MDLVAGAMGKLPGKLLELLKDEYNLQKSVQKSVRPQVELLARELESMYTALCKVAQVPSDQLDLQVRFWVRDIREASYDMEDVLDTFLVCVDGGSQPAADPDKVKRLLNKMGMLFKLKARHEIAGAIEGIKKQLEEMTLRRDRYKVDNIVAKPATTSTEPHLSALYTKTSQLIGMIEPMDQLIKMLSLDVSDDPTNEMKIVSVVGFGGLGKTTLAKVVHDKHKSGFHENGTAFVSVGPNPDLKKLFRDILIDLDKELYTSKFNLMILDENQLIIETHEFLKNKRYFLVIDDIWDVSSWEIIKLCLVENNLACKIIITTRNHDVAEQIGSSYYMKTLSEEISRSLFYGRIFGSKEMCPGVFSVVSEKILKKCGGVPLAICTISSLLANKNGNVADWYELCDSIGSGHAKDPYMSIRKILSLSYYDLPPHLKTCLLYLSIFPEDFNIRIDRLILRWIAEDFIKQVKTGDSLYEIGWSYFNELVNRSMIQLSENTILKGYCTCRVHDVVHDLICSFAKEESFVTISHDIEQNTLLQTKDRRLSLQKTSKDRRLSLQKTSGATSYNMSFVRSFTVFGPAIDSMPMLSSFHALRVLDLEECNLQGYNLTYVGSLVQLRYLGLRNTGYAGELPKDLGKLQFLQTLDLVDTHVRELPASLMQLKRLMILWLDMNTRLPSGIRNLKALEELWVGQFIQSTNFVEELGGLANLRVLKINMRKADEVLRQQDVNALGRLPFLEDLQMHRYKVATGETLTVNSGMFPCLTEMSLYETNIVPVFRTGSAPRLRDLWLNLNVREMMDAWNGSFDFGLENLGCLEKFEAEVDDDDATEMEREAVVEGLRRARDTNPNGATFYVYSLGRKLL